MGAAVMSNSTAWQMIHRRILNPTDPRGNDSTVVDDAATLFLATPEAVLGGGEALLLARQVQARLAARPLALHGAVFASAAAFLARGAPAFTPAWLTKSLPPGVLLHSLTQIASGQWYPPAPGAKRAEPLAAGAGASVGVRLQQLPHAAPASLDVVGDFLALGARVASAGETTLDFNVDKAAADARRLTWRTLDDAAVGREPSAPAVAHVKPGSPSPLPSTSVGPTAAFDAEFVRAYVVDLAS
jgi:hypothetical protein